MTMSDIQRSYSHPSIGTAGTMNISTSPSALSRAENLGKRLIPVTKLKRGSFLWQGWIGKITYSLAMLPWMPWWQILVLATVTYTYFILFLNYMFGDHLWLDISIYFTEIVFFLDVANHLLHAYWSLVRIHVRAFRRNTFFLIFDAISLLPLRFLAGSMNYSPFIQMAILGRFLMICRIYRLLAFIRTINEAMHSSRKIIFIFEHIVSIFLVLHAGTCLWYRFHNGSLLKQPWHLKGYPSQVGSKNIKFDQYLTCFYYCTCRFYSVLFGDSFPGMSSELWLTSFLMLIGYAVFKYRFIGLFAWEYVKENSRRIAYIDQYRHMLDYLKFRGAPIALIEQAEQYKMMLWNMKDGIVTSNHLQKLPTTLQMELIFDINVGFFHKSRVFQDTVDFVYCRRLRAFSSASSTVIFESLVRFKKNLSTIVRMEFQDGHRLYHHAITMGRDAKQKLLSTGLSRYEEAFMRHISLHMHHEIYLAGQYIWNQDVVKSGVICIKHGVIEMLSDEDDESPMIAFTEGTVLGELSLFYSIPAKVTVKAATYVELQVLKRTDFMLAMSEQPRMLASVRKKLEKRVDDAIRKQTAIIKYESADMRLIRTRYRPMKVLKDHLAGAEPEDPTFVDDSHMYYRDENNERQAKFTSEYLHLYNLSENVSNMNSPRICLRAAFPCILEPNTDFTKLCDFIHFLAVLYVCTILPYQEIMAEEITDVHRVVTSTVLVSGLFFNLYIQLTTAIIKKNVRKVTVKDIAAEKMSTIGFYLDIISVFPMSIFADALDRQGETVAGQIAYLTPALQVWHIWDYMQKWQNNFKSNVKLVCLVKYVILICIFSYWTGCFLYLFACPRKLCGKSCWMTQLVFWETKVFLTRVAKHERVLLTSIYFGTTIFTNSGNAEISPGYHDLILVILLIALGALLQNFYTAKMCSLYNLSTARRLKFKESMRELFYFLSANHVNRKIKDRVRKFFCVQWYHNKAISIDEIFKDMSPNIQQEVLSIEMVETLTNCPLFQECSRDFLQTVAANTRIIVLPDNEVVQRTADIGRDMYILQKGHCNIIDNTGKVVSTIVHGQHFGVMEMFFGLPKVYTVLTTTNCILLHVEYSALMQCLSTFPDISYPINMILEDKELLEKASKFEVVKVMTGKIDAKINRIAQELKESFVFLSTRKDEYSNAFNILGILRYIKYIIVPITITPYGIFLKLWCLFRFCLAIYYVIVCPYNLATRHYTHSSSENLIDITLYLDIVIMAYVAYYDERNILITHPLYTISHYLKNGFILDFITAFPFDLIFKIINENIDMDLYRINRLLQVARITTAFMYWESDIMRVNHLVVLFKFLPIAVTIVNIATAVLYYTSCVSFPVPDSYFIMANCSRSMVIGNDNAITQQAMFEYLCTFFWAFCMFIGCSSVSVFPITDVDIWVVIFLEITGLLYFAFMFGYVACSRTTTTNALLEHMEKTKDLANFLFQQNVDPVLTMKTVKYFEYIWKRTNGSNPQQICRCLNSALMEDTLVFMYEKTLREVPLFGKVDRSFIRVITQHLHEMYFLKGETVIQSRDVQPYIYIIYRGKVDVLNPYNEMLTCMGPGGMFGNFTGQSISCSEVTVYASRSLDLLVISSQIFFNLVKYYPKIQEPLKKAFERSKEYILPISMDIDNDADSSDESEADVMSEDSGGSSTRSGSGIQPATRVSHYSLSRSEVKSYASSHGGLSYMHHNIFRPGSRMFQSFGYVICLMATLNYVFVSYELVTMNDCYLIVWINSMLDIFFYIKIYLRLHQGYSNKYGDVIMDQSRCRNKYFKNKLRFLTDIIVNFPLEIFALCFNSPMRFLHYLRVLKLGRLKYLVEFYKDTAAELTNSLVILQTMLTVSLIVVFVHTFTCLWLLLVIALNPIKNIRPIKLYQVNDYNVPTNDYWDYVTSFYIVSASLTSAGGEEIAIDGRILWIICICMLSGKLLAAVVVATAMQVAYSTKHALNKYENDTGELIDVLKNQGLSTYQLTKFWKYVTQLWITERGRQLPALLAETPYVRRCDLMSAMFGQYLRNSFLFSDTGEAFLRQLTAVMKYTIFFPGNYIVVAGDSEACMYWVVTGSVAVVSVRADLTETTHEILTNGDVFGIMQGINKGISHCFSYRAETNVNVVSLSLDNWIHILQYFPEANRSIVDKMETLYAHV